MDVVSEVGDRYRVIVRRRSATRLLLVIEIEAGRPGRVAPGADVRFCSTESGGADEAKALGVRRWAVIHAPEGGFGIDEVGGYVEIPSLSLPDGFIAGTVGAGDAFCAGVLLGAHDGESLSDAIEDGVAAAACSLRSAGASGASCRFRARALAATLPRQKLRG